MFLSWGWFRRTFVVAKNVRRVTPEIIQCDCPECGGDGDWSKFYPHLEDLSIADRTMPCVACKGTGRIYA